MAPTQTVYSSIDCIYTDGACSGNPGPGGWGTVVYFKDGSVHELGGAAAETTNNRMELQAAISALDFLARVDQSTPITLHTDSQYVKNGITQWIRGWKRKGWKTASGKAVLNKDLWEKLDALNSAIRDQLPLEWKYVKGHSGNVGNDRCDQIARAFSTGTPIQLKQAEGSVSSTTATKKNTPSAPPSSSQLKQTELTPELVNVGIDDSGDSLALPIALMSKATSSDQDMTIQSRGTSEHSDSPDPAMADSRSESSMEAADLPRDVAVAQLRHVVETLHMADEVASQGYLITSSELAALMDIHASAVTSRGNNWVWRNWMVSRVRREGNQILWQLERID